MEGMEHIIDINEWPSELLIVNMFAINMNWQHAHDESDITQQGHWPCICASNDMQRLDCDI